MDRPVKKDKFNEDELEPAIAKVVPKGDQVSAVIGEVGRWQIEKILIVFLAAAPGIEGYPEKVTICPPSQGYLIFFTLAS